MNTNEVNFNVMPNGTVICTYKWYGIIYGLFEGKEHRLFNDTVYPCLPSRVYTRTETTKLAGYKSSSGLLLSDIDYAVKFNLIQHLGLNLSLVESMVLSPEELELYKEKVEILTTWEKVYETTVKETDQSFNIFYIPELPTNKFIKPSRMIDGGLSTTYQLEGSVVNIVTEVAKKYGFVWEASTWASNIKNKFGYTHFDSGSSLKFSTGYAKNTNLDRIPLKCIGTLEECEAKYNKVYEEVEKEFTRALALINPNAVNILDVSTFYGKLEDIEISLDNIDATKKTYDYLSKTKTKIRNLKSQLEIFVTDENRG